MRTALLFATLLGVAVYAQDPAPTQDVPKESVEDLIKKLGADEFAIREEAQKKLEAMGAEVLPKLKEAREKAEDPETKSRLGDLIGKIEKPKSTGEEVPAAGGGRKPAPTPEETLEKAKKILEEMAKLVGDKDRPVDEKVRELTRLSRSLDQALRPNAADWNGGGMDGMRIRAKILRDGNGGFKIEKEELPAPEKKEEAPAQKTPGSGEEKKVEKKEDK